MRGLKSFALLLVAAIGLGAYLYFVESKRTPGGDLPKKDKVFTVEADTIDEVTIRSESGDRTTIRRNGTDWQIVQPIAAQVDAAEVSGITSNLSSVEIQRVIDESPADLKEFGLAEPRIQVTFKAGGKDQTLQIGRKTPAGTDLYAKLGDQKKVFLIASFLDATFNRSTFDLRDKTVLKVEAAKVDSVEVVTSTRTLKFAKKDGEWNIEQPVATRADFGAVEGLVGTINSAQMKSIAATDATDLKPYGLDTPVATVRIGIGSSQAALAIGASSGQGAVYAKDLSRPAVFTIESTLLVAFEKTKIKDKDGKDDEKWTQVAPAARDVDSAKVEALLSVATSARAMGFVTGSTKTNLDKPELTVAIRFDQGKVDRVSFSRSGADGYAQRAGSPGAATVETATIDNIIKTLEEIK